MTQYGIDATFETFESSFGTSIPGYVITAPDDHGLDESRCYIDECEMRECLESHGEPTDPQSDGWELAQQAQALLRDGMNSSSGAPVTDCLTAAGIDSL